MRTQISITEAYKILEINPPFSPDQLKSAYRKAAMKHHPDKGGDTNLFVKAKDAYDLLKVSGGGKQRIRPEDGTKRGPFQDSAFWDDVFRGMNFDFGFPGENPFDDNQFDREAYREQMRKDRERKQREQYERGYDKTQQAERKWRERNARDDRDRRYTPQVECTFCKGEGFAEFKKEVRLDENNSDIRHVKIEQRRCPRCNGTDRI